MRVSVIINEARVNADLRNPKKEITMFFTDKRHKRETNAERKARRDESFRRRFENARRSARFWL